MAGLTSKTPALTYKDLLTVHTEAETNQGLETSLKPIEDGEGVQSALQISTTDVNVDGHNGTKGLKLAGTTVTASAVDINKLTGRAFGDSSAVVTLSASQSLDNKTIDGGTFI
jgi:hypothetical protein